MKGKQLAIVLVLLVALGGVALFLSRRNAATWSSTATESEGRILNFPLNDVSHITVKTRDEELNLAKKDDVWRVKERSDYPANFEQISALIRKMWELRAVQDVKIGPSQFGRLQLVDPSQDPNSGTLLDFKGEGDKPISALLLGKKNLRDSSEPLGGGGIPSGRYVRKTDNSNRVFLIADTLDEVQTKPEQWLNRDFVKVENPKSIMVTGTTAGMNWKLTRDNATAPWKLADAKPGEELDSAKVSVLATLFSGASFADVLAPDAKPVETGLDKSSSARIETFDNFLYELRIGKLMGENYPVLVSVTAALPNERTPGKDEKPEDKTKLDQEFQAQQTQLKDKLANEQELENRPYLIAKSTIDQLLKDRSALMAEKKTLSSPTAATSPAGKKAASLPKSPRAAPRADISPASSSSPIRRPPK
jgi:hypothetical protein